MFDRIRNYFYDRRRGFATLVGAAGSLYVIGQYVLQRLEEAREQVMQDRQARENLKRRFQQNQQDVSYQIMALMPSLGDQLLGDMNVEEVIADLQSKSRLVRRPLESRSLESSVASSVDLPSDTQSDVGSMSIISSVGNEPISATSFHPTEGSSSWVIDRLSTRSQSHPRQSGFSREASPIRNAIVVESPQSGHASLSDSVATSSGSADSPNVAPAAIPPVETVLLELVIPETPTTANIKSKAELWNEVKILTFTRTLCVLYATTLLSLLTTIQLNLLGRSKYIQSILQLERDEKRRERLEFEASISSLFYGGIPDDRGLEVDVAPDLLLEMEGLSEETERKYLTLSWWFLNLGYKDVGERVRRAVEETLESVSLKTKVSIVDLHRIVQDIRRRVEFEITFERQERRMNFLSAVLPHTPETLHHVLTQGGIPTALATHPDATFDALLSETHQLVLSRDFDRVLEVCLDRATEVLVESLRKNIFNAGAGTGAGSMTGSSLSGSVERPMMGLAETPVIPPPSVPVGEEEEKLRLAGLLPGLARWSNLALTGLPNELVDSITSVREMSAFSAIIYSGFEDRFR